MNKAKSQIWIGQLLLAGLLIHLLLSGCQTNPAPYLPGSVPQTSTIAPQEAETQQSLDEQIISTPTLAPTATPGPIDLVVEDISENTGLDDLNIWGLSGENLADLLISILIVIIGSLTGWMAINVIVWLTRFTPPSFDDQLLTIIQNQLKWLLALFSLEFSTTRLDFLSPQVKQRLDLIYFSIFIVIISILILKVIEYGLEKPLARAATPRKRNLLVTFLPLIYRSIQVGIVIAGLVIILKNFGVNLSALLAILGLGGLALSLAAKETLADMISGFIILIDRPYQIGDRIKIETMDNWGDVEAIGIRTTRIRTLDNRMVIVPNSVIGRNQVENFADPDPSIRVDLTIGIGYESNIDHATETIKAAVLGIPEISDREPPFVELSEFGDSALVLRVLYWLESYTDIRVQTKVNIAIYQALTNANIEMPFITYDVNLSYKER